MLNIDSMLFYSNYTMDGQSLYSINYTVVFKIYGSFVIKILLSHQKDLS
jgi:hypothetical protein